MAVSMSLAVIMIEGIVAIIATLAALSVWSSAPSLVRIASNVVFGESAAVLPYILAGSGWAVEVERPHT